MRDSHYDGFAEAYAKQNETGLFNAYYEKPAMLALAGDVSGRRILDAGCGAGPTMAALRKAGASVVGFDVSAAMVEAGAAWVFDRYAKDPTLYELQQDARQSRRGLWALPPSDQTPPWEWRRASRH